MYDLTVDDHHNYFADGILVSNCHYVKSKTAKRSQAAYRLCGKSKQRLLLSGTPLLNRPVELQPLAGLCDPDRFGDPLVAKTPQCWTFLKRYCGAHKELRGRQLVWVFDGATNLDELQERLRASCMVRRLKEEVLGELPPKRRQIVPVEASMPETPASRVWWESLQAAEAEAALAVVEKDKSAYKEASEKLRYLNAVAFTEMSEYRHRLGIAKVSAAVEYVADLVEGGVDKVLVFAHHRDVLQQMRGKFEEAGLGPVLLYGSMTNEQKDEAVTRFQGKDGVAADPACKIFLGQNQAAGVGLTLTAASHVVCVEPDWVPAQMTQIEDRAHRIGQRDVVFVHHLVVDDTLDAHMVKKLVWKQEIADQALDIAPPYEDGVDPGSLAKEPRQKVKAIRKVPEFKMLALLKALRSIAMACDGAVARDDQGFNGTDSGFGKKLAALDVLSDAQFYAGWRLIRKYRNTQLSAETVKVLELDREQVAPAEIAEVTS